MAKANEVEGGSGGLRGQVGKPSGLGGAKRYSFVCVLLKWQKETLEFGMKGKVATLFDGLLMLL
jgi:hypothetical protein